MDQPKKRKIYSTPSKKSANYREPKRSKLPLKIKINRAIAASLAVATIGGTAIGAKGIISNMAMDYKKAENAKTAVEIAAQYDKYLYDLEYKFNYGQEKMNSEAYASDIYDWEKEKYSQVIEYRVDGTKKLTEAIKTYNELKYERNRTVTQESEFVSSCEIIANSTDLVVELYSDAIREKVAKADRITDPYKIYDIIIKAEGSMTPELGMNWISTIQVGHEQKKLSKDLKKVVKSARELLDVEKEYDPNTTAFKDMPVDDIIDKYQEAMEFNSKYDIEYDKKGNLTLKEREQNKQKNVNTENKINDTVDKERD